MTAPQTPALVLAIIVELLIGLLQIIVQVRRWDDGAKVPHKTTSPHARYLFAIERVVALPFERAG